MREPLTTVTVTCDICSRKSSDDRETSRWKLIRVPSRRRGYLDSYTNEDWCDRCWEHHLKWKNEHKEKQG